MTLVSKVTRIIPEAIDDLGQVVVELARSVQVGADLDEAAVGRLELLQRPLALAARRVRAAALGRGESLVGMLQPLRQRGLLVTLLRKRGTVDVVPLRKPLREEVLELRGFDVLHRELALEAGDLGQECGIWQLSLEEAWDKRVIAY